MYKYPNILHKYCKYCVYLSILFIVEFFLSKSFDIWNIMSIIESIKTFGDALLC